MSKRKISFDIDINDFDKIKLIVKSSHKTQGEFLREIVHKAVSEFDDRILTVYTIENGILSRQIIDKRDYEVEIDNSVLTKELVKDFSFISSGYLIKSSVKTRFYSKLFIRS